MSSRQASATRSQAFKRCSTARNTKAAGISRCPSACWVTASFSSRARVAEMGLQRLPRSGLLSRSLGHTSIAALWGHLTTERDLRAPLSRFYNGHSVRPGRARLDVELSSNWVR